MAESHHSSDEKKHHLSDTPKLPPPSAYISQLKSDPNPKNRWIKFLNDNQTHRTIKYEEGKVVEDTIPFAPEGACKPGGLYFTNYANCVKWYRNYGSNKVAYIEFCPDSKVYAEPCGTKWKADKFNVVKIGCMWDDEEICLAAVSPNGHMLKNVKNQTDEICLAAVKQNGCVLEVVKNQTEEICLEAVRQFGFALQFVKNQTDKICIEAAKQNDCALQFVKNQTEAICLAAVKKNGKALKIVKNQTEEICLAAVKQNGMALEFVEHQTEEICLAAVKNSKRSLQLVNIKINFARLF